MARLLAVARAQPLLAAGFALALALTLFFVLRTTLFVLYWADPAHRNQPIEGWMTPGYVAHSWKLPPEAVRAALGRAAPPPGERRTLAEIAEASGIPLKTLIARLEAAAEAGAPRR